MRERPAAASRPSSGRRTSFTVDVVVFAPRGNVLGVLCEPGNSRARERRVLPFGVPRPSEPLEKCARRLVRDLTDAEPAWIEQIGAFADGKRHVTDAELSIGFVAVMPPPPERDGEVVEWASPSDLGGLTPRQQAIASAALLALRTRMDHAPIAFRLLPPQFTLSELQQAYELLLGKRLHKASFRRALQAAFLVQPTDEWRSEGRGRPAQFFEFAPRKRRGGRRGVRFDLMG